MAANMKKIGAFIELLETYRGRDKIVRLLSYLLQLLSSSAKRFKYLKLEKICSVLSKEFSNLRVLTRLFDDMAMLKWSFQYGFGTKEDDMFSRILQVTQNLVDQCYYPIEHIAWAQDAGIVKGSSHHFWYFGCALWLISLSMALVTALKNILLLQKEIMNLKKESAQREHSGDERNTDDISCIISKQMSELKTNQRHLVTDICEYAVDMINAVHWLPSGFLWASKLPEGVVGALGTVSSLCQIYKTIYPLQSPKATNKTN